nr:reverse transcriptase domain-containing protein [Tanacetum cinerariifolium]
MSFIEPGTGLRMKRTNRRTRALIGLYSCHIEEKMTIKEVRGESFMEWKTKVTTKEGIVIQFPRKFHGYKLATEEEMEENEGFGVLDIDLVFYEMDGVIFEIVLYVLSLTVNVNNTNEGNGNGGNNGSSNKTFTACNPKEFDGKGSAVALTHWIEKMDLCLITVSAILTARILTDEAVRCGTLTKGNDKRKEMEESILGRIGPSASTLADVTGETESPFTITSQRE